VQEYVEHHRPVKGAARMSEYDVQDARSTASFYGSGQHMEQRAWDGALSLIRG
jgi:hypothetical protein